MVSRTSALLVVAVTCGLSVSYCAPVLPESNGNTLNHVFSGKCLDTYPYDNKVNAYIWDCNGNGSQEWAFRSDGSLLHIDSGKCLDVSPYDDHTSVYIWDCNGNPSQQWHRDGRRIVNGGSGKCLDAYPADDRTTAYIWPCNDNDSQMWDGIQALSVQRNLTEVAQTQQKAAMDTMQPVQTAPTVSFMHVNFPRKFFVSQCRTNPPNGDCGLDVNCRGDSSTSPPGVDRCTTHNVDPTKLGSFLVTDTQAPGYNAMCYVPIGSTGTYVAQYQYGGQGVGGVGLCQQAEASVLA